MRIVSLLASATEIVCALGYEDQLVGRSHECDFPLTVQRLPACSEPKINIDASASDIDRQVKKIVQETLSVYRVDADKLKELHPDIIVTQDQCEVCAVSFKDVENAVCQWLPSKPKIVTLKTDSLKDLWKDIRQVAEALGDGQEADCLIQRCQKRIAAISRKALQLNEHPSVVCIEWFDPLMAAGHWIPEFVELLGGHNVFGEAGKHAPWITWEKLQKTDPDAIVTMPCGWDITRSLKEIKTLTDNPFWNELKAVKQDRVYLTDGNQYFNRSGPRLVESLEILAEIMYPEAFSFGHKNRGWRKL